VKKLGYLFVLIFMGIFSACSSVGSDAKKAADLMDKSMEATTEYDFDRASDYYRQYKELENKYKNTPEQTEFEEAYWKYKLENQG